MPGELEAQFLVRSSRGRGRSWPKGSSHVVAFARTGGLLAVAPRLVVGLARRGGWGDTVLTLPDGSWRDVLTGTTSTGTVAVAQLLGGFPVAVLEAR